MIKLLKQYRYYIVLFAVLSVLIFSVWFVLDKQRIELYENYKPTVMYSDAEEMPEPVIEVVVQELPKETDNHSVAPFIISGASVAEIAQAIDRTYLDGIAETLYICENEYGVNFRFIYAIGAMESGRGKYLSNSYNYFGLTNGRGKYTAFNSKEHSVLYLAGLLSSDLYRDKTINDIAKIYCPPNASKWAKDVSYLMDEI